MSNSFIKLDAVPFLKEKPHFNEKKSTIFSEFKKCANKFLKYFFCSQESSSYFSVLKIALQIFRLQSSRKSHVRDASTCVCACVVMSYEDKNHVIHILAI